MFIHVLIYYLFNDIFNDHKNVPPYLEMDPLEIFTNPEAEFLEEIQKKFLRVFHLTIHMHPLQLCLEISISSNSRNLLSSVTVHCKGERRKT
jgi:hypothetical protein